MIRLEGPDRDVSAQSGTEFAASDAFLFPAARRIVEPVVSEASDWVWLSTAQATRRVGVTTRTLYRFIDDGLVPAYRMGRVLRLVADDVDAFIERSRIEPGSLRHLYPPPLGDAEGDAETG
jgi:excisionase family DNA binding protein